MYRSIDPAEDHLLKQVITDRFALAPGDRGYSWREVLPKEKRSPHHRHHRHPRHQRHPLLARRRRRRHRQLAHRPADFPQARGNHHLHRGKPPVRLRRRPRRRQLAHQVARRRRPPPPLRGRPLPAHRKGPAGERGLRCRQVPRLPPVHGEDRHRRSCTPARTRCPSA